ncbi:MAG: alkaline phosphatase family protein [Candidatus Dormibacteraeota bacterium]|nr:alkaline phosphatase family protein [Candidatus Dormibacteraeota bacterium]
MKFLGLRTAIVVLGAAIVVGVPTALVLGRTTAKSTALAHPLAAETNRDFDDHQAQIASRPARPTLAPTPATASARAAATATAMPNPVAPSHAATPAPALAAVPGFSHVFVIVMENHEYGSVIGRPDAPYVNSLAAAYGLATNYYAASHPSLPNYFALTAGSTFGVASDCTTCYVSATNIADQVESSGRSWKAYMEDMPAPCSMSVASGNYAMKHNPFMYYTDIRNYPARCGAHVVPFTQFAVDMSTGQVPNFVWITPNMCNDTHDCPVSTGDAWLGSIVPRITGSAAFRNGGVLFITWDEGSTNASCCGDAWGGHVATLVISPRSIPGVRSTIAENHYSLLRTIEDGFGLAHLGAAGWSSSVPMREYFR